MMEKQKSFSVKPIKFLVSSFTIAFSIIFVIFCFTWVFKSPPLIDLSAQNLGLQTSRDFSDTSSEDFLLKNSILMGKNSSSSSQTDAGVAVARGVTDEREGSLQKNSILMGRNSNSSSQSGADVAAAAAVNDESEGSLLTANSRFAHFGNNNSNDNMFVDDFNVSVSTKPSVDESVGVLKFENLDEKVEVLNGVEKNISREREVRTSDEREEHTKPALDESVGLLKSENLDEKVEELNVMEKNISRERETRISEKREEHSTIRSSIEDKSRVGCDVTLGQWVYDESYPLYTNVTCPFIDEGFGCESNGRLDKGYMKWRWQPQDCDIPRFNATKVLELIRGKRLVFVGDSLNRNQWESMLCLLMRGVKDPNKVYEARGRKITKERGNYCFKFEEYKCTVEFYVSHYLVHESKARIGKKKGQTLRIDAIDKGSSRWKGADILVFNTAHWWNHQKTKAGINYYQEGNQVHPRLDVTTAFKRALLTWASWADRNINPQKTRIFFRSSAPAHFSGGQWDTGGHCKEAFRPINETLTSIYPDKNLIMEEVLRQMKTPVTFLNITRLSDYRPDAHPSIYGRKAINPGVQDCSHWCLPGVPDVWNELLYYHLHSRDKAIL